MKIKTRVTFLFFVSVTALSFIGCSTLETGAELVTGVTSYFLGGEDNKVAPAKLVEYEPELEIDVLWKEDVGVGTDDQFLNLVLAISDGTVLTADKEGLVQARETKTGGLIWETETEFIFSAGPSIGKQTVILASSNAEVVALDFVTGEQKWVSTVSSEVLARPVIAKGIVIIRTTDGKLVALNEDDGSEIWEFERSVPALSIRGTGSPIIIEDNVIAGYANGKLISLRLVDGKNTWETSIVIPSGRSEIERLVDLDVDPVETDGVIFISSFQGGTSAVLELDGDVLWQNEDVSSFSGLSYDLRYLYISDAESHVWQLDQRNGNSLWKQDKLHHRKLSAPIAYEEYVVVGDYDGYIHWLSGSDGRQLARIKVSKQGIDTKLVVVENTIYAYSKDGTLVALKARLF